MIRATDRINPSAAIRDPGILLSGQLQLVLGGDYRVTLERERDWASATFAGTRHSYRVERIDGGAVNVERLAELASHEFVLDGRFVADCCARGDGATLELLTIVDPVADGRARH